MRNSAWNAYTNHERLEANHGHHAQPKLDYILQKPGLVRASLGLCHFLGLGHFPEQDHFPRLGPDSENGPGQEWAC